MLKKMKNIIGSNANLRSKKDYFLHFSALEKKQVPLCTIRKLHGYRGVSSIKLIDDSIISTGRDGTFRQLTIDESVIKVIDCNKLQMEWIATIEDTSIYGPLIFGFHDTYLIIWSCREGRPFLKLDCGGGHRSWDYYFNEYSNTLCIVFIKNKCVYRYNRSLSLLNYRTAEVGYHSKSINAACILDIQKSRANYILTGGEDNTLRLFFWDNKIFQPQITLYRHISSIRAVHCLKVSTDNSFFVATSGGRGQLIMWQVLECKGKIKIVEAASHMVREAKGQHKNFKQIQPLSDPETRYMDINIVKISENRFLILAGCSDGFFRILNFNADNNTITVAKVCNFHEHCILKVAHFIWEDLIAITMTSGGEVAFWNVNTQLNQCDTQIEPVSFRLHSLGINSYSLLFQNDALILVTGSDDSTLVVSVFNLKQKNSYSLLTSWKEKSLHTCQITGVQMLKNYIISVALDQKISLLEWDYSDRCLTVNFIKQVVTSVPDIHGLLAWFKPQSCLNVCIFGLGIEIFKYETKHGEQRRQVEEEKLELNP